MVFLNPQKNKSTYFELYAIETNNIIVMFL